MHLLDSKQNRIQEQEKRPEHARNAKKQWRGIQRDMKDSCIFQYNNDAYPIFLTLTILLS